jgi:hypothetical protein
MPKKVKVMEKFYKEAEKEAFQCEVCGQNYKKLEEAQECEAKETRKCQILETPGAIYVTAKMDQGWDEYSFESIDEFWRVVDRIVFQHKSYPVLESTSGKRIAVGFYYYPKRDDYDRVGMEAEEDPSEFVMVSRRQLEVVARWLKEDL